MCVCVCVCIEFVIFIKTAFNIDERTRKSKLK